MILIRHHLGSSVGGTTPCESKTDLHTIIGEKASSHDNQTDLERGVSPNPDVTALPDGNTQPRDPNIVDWEGPDDPENPLNWPFKKKMVTTVIISTITLVT